jgi:hypothetical protein
MSRLRHLGLAAALAGALACGCTATPLPEPPAETLNIDRIHAPEYSPATTIIEIVGDPGAGPPGHTLRVTNLDNDNPPVDVVIAGDGSFAVSLSGDLVDELRFQTRSGRDRAQPIDMIWGSRTVMPAARIECVQPEPLQQQDFELVTVGGSAASRTIVVRNDCPDSVEVTAAGLRSVDSAFALGNPEILLPLSIDPAAEATWTIDFAPAEMGDAEEIFFLQLSTGGEQERYPITLYGDGE